MERKRTGGQVVWLAVVGWLLVVRPVAAHNGAVAVAVPVEGITVDGDLSDWPEEMREYPIELAESGVKPVDEEDFQGSFRIGYNEQENALYLAVEVEDESVVVDTTVDGYRDDLWNTQDGCEVYVDIAYKGEGSPVQYAIYGNERRSGGYKVEVRRSARASV